MERIEKVSGPHLKKCRHCGGKVESLISASAIQFKGAGWYVTDYAGKKSSGADGSKSDKPATDAKETATKETAAKDTGSKEAKETKPTKKK
jgi:predicted nucleic acid-binding Zn ribbon protein